MVIKFHQNFQLKQTCLYFENKWIYHITIKGIINKSCDKRKIKKKVKYEKWYKQKNSEELPY